MKFLKIFLIPIIVFTFLSFCSCSKNDNAGPGTKEPVKTDTPATAAEHEPEISCEHGHPEGQLCITPVASKVSEYSMAGNYKEAIKVLVEAKDVPGYQWDAKKIYDSMIYLYDKTEQYDKNLEVWKDGHNKGLVFDMDSTRIHFKPYLKLAGFNEIYTKDIEMQKKTKEQGENK